MKERIKSMQGEKFTKRTGHFLEKRLLTGRKPTWTSSTKNT